MKSTKIQGTKDLITVLPFDPEFKEALSKRYDTLTPDQQYAVEDILWNFYDSVYELRLQTNMDAAFERAKKNKEVLDESFYQRVREQTEREFEKESSMIATVEHLSDTREELAKILKQIPNAS